MKLYRSIMFVPGNRADWIEKAPKYGPDALMIDLEDAVPIAEKYAARKIVRAGIEQLRGRGVGRVAGGVSRCQALPPIEKCQRSLKASGRMPRTWRQPPKM